MHTSLSRDEQDRHLSERNQAGRLYERHKTYCSWCKKGEFCIDAERWKRLVEGLNDWTVNGKKETRRGK